MNVAMWRKALGMFQHVEKAEWVRLDFVSKWLIATRAAILFMTFSAAAVAGILAARDGQFRLGPWLLLTIGLIFAHGTNNLLNDLTDYRKGVDKDNYFRMQYGSQPLEQGLWTERDLLTYAGISGLIALGCGVWLALQSGPLAWLLLAVGAFFVFFYTWPLKYIGLGELTVLLVWGPLMVAGGYFVITGQWNWNAVLISLPYGLGITTVIFGKHIDKHDPDKAKGIHTLPVIIGERAARVIVLIMIALQYLLTLFLVLTGRVSASLLIVFLAAPTLRLVRTIYRTTYPQERPEWLPAEAWPTYFAAAAFVHNRRFGMLFLVGLLADAALHLLHVV